MFEDFTPDTDLERAFAQASGLDIDRLWKEADRSGDREDWNRFFGQSSCLSYQLAAAGQQPHLNTVTTAMVACIDHLTSAQQRSLFKVSTYVVNRLLDQDVRLESIETRLVLRVMCRVLRKPGWSRVEFVNMQRGGVRPVIPVVSICQTAWFAK